MRLSTVYARFYKSFNFDHIRKATPYAQPKGDWEMFRDAWYPYVEVEFDSRITTIVGANESGKSHLLSAVEKAVSGIGFEQRDLCRYSPFFSVEREATCWPHLGLGWSMVESDEAEAIANVAGAKDVKFDRFMMFRETPEALDIWIPDPDKGWKKHVVEASSVAQPLADILPKPFRIMPDVALPAAVPLHWLANGDAQPSSISDRRQRTTLLEVAGSFAEMLGDDKIFAANAPNIRLALSPIANALREARRVDGAEKSLALARDLLLKLGNVEPARLKDLREAIADGKEGYANALVEAINEQLERYLNFKKWWVQDRDFSLKVTPREHELVFTIRDRTGTEYTFDERSSGLKYFLSYLIQAQSHRPQTERESLLLMDEPDTYLSAEAQQDLMKVLQDLADPQDGRPPVQVIYVTHSPFLLDKNYAERIRVLEKGRGYDGTRVVRNVSRNHYEPLRSAFGAFVGETAFVGSVNLLVEGITEQVLLAGAARIMRQRRPGVTAETLDLNNLVIVPCGSASEIPYMLYLIRGRDTDKPPVVALLDSDPAGNDAANHMRTDKKAKRLIDSQHVLQLGALELADGVEVKEIEDLIPVELATAAMNACIGEITRFRDTEAPTISLQSIQAQIETGKSMFAAIQAVAKAESGHIEKLGFARAVVETIERDKGELQGPIDIFLERMSSLFKAVNKARRQAQREANRERLGAMIMRYHRIFIRDHKSSGTCEQGAEILEEIQSQLDDTPQSDDVRIRIQVIRREFALDEDPSAAIPHFEAFVESLANLRLPMQEVVEPDTTSKTKVAASISSLFKGEAASTEAVELLAETSPSELVQPPATATKKAAAGQAPPASTAA
ncbi:AAA family ATPase [Mesorhizobium sp. M1233]|uniref:AAA family ATPase n=2 Tax=unclassified Mesorhizobium TaxID=325217 RepID=UPI00333D960A